VGRDPWASIHHREERSGASASVSSESQPGAMNPVS
jgi:hypothetical protein